MSENTSPTGAGFPAPSEGDTRELDALFDLLVDAAHRGEPFDLNGWLTGREHLRVQAERVARLAAGVTAPCDATVPTLDGFTIVGEIGRGGMGVVYRALQHTPRRTVALKVMRASLVSPCARRRFELEAELLARLEHPGIARMYASGIDPRSGDPFFVMELVEGQPIDDHAAAGGLSTRQRLDLLAQTCDAVEHAHQKGVIHRDLKPSNILVDRAGRPRILDFGVARLTDADVSITTAHTDMGALIGTVPYMSPEQAAGDPSEIDTRSDIYALGVVAYKLLTGRLPYDIEQKLVHEAVRIIREDDPTPMSSINRSLAGDVQTIVGKALSKEKPRRYQSASALADDIRRYLTDQPIAARPASAAYQFGKFAKRHKAVVAGAGATGVVLVAGIAATSWQAVIATRARDQARASLALAEQRAAELESVAAFQESQLSGIETRAMGVRLRDAVLSAAGEDRRATLESALARVNFTDIAIGSLDHTILERARNAIESNFADQPVVKARLLQAVADTVRDLGLLDGAIPPQTQALDIRRRELGSDDPRTLTSISRMGDLFRALGKYAEAEALCREALEGRERALGPDDPDTLESMAAMGSLMAIQGKNADAAPVYRETLERRRRALGEEHPDTLASMHGMAYMLGREGKQDEALQMYLDVLEKRKRVLGADHRDTLATMHSVGSILNQQRRFAEAEPYLQRSLGGRRRVLGEYHPDTLNALNSMGPLLWGLGRAAEGEPYYREVYEKRRLALGSDHPDTVISANNLAMNLKLVGRYAEAEPYLRDALESARRTYGPDHSTTLIFTTNMGDLLVLLGRAEEAIGVLEPAELAVRALSRDGNPRRLGLFLSNMGRARAGIGYDAARFAQAESELLEAHALLVKDAAPSPRDTIECTRALVALYTAWNESEPGKGYDAKAAEWAGRLPAESPESR